MNISTSTPIAALTVEQFVELLAEIGMISTNSVSEPATPDVPDGRRYVYGLKGIQDLFHCSHVTAQRYKDGIIAGAVYQCGRKITVDVDKALQLAKEARSKK